MNHGVMAIVAVLAVPLSVAYGETISVQDDYSDIIIQIDGDRLVTYSVSFADGSEPISPVKPKLEVRSFGFLIIDKPGGFFAVLKNTDAGYEIKTRMNAGSGTIVGEYVFENTAKDGKQPEKPPAEKPPAEKPPAEKPPAEKPPAEKQPSEPKNSNQRDLLGSTILVPDEGAVEEDTKPAFETQREEAKRLLDEALKKQEEQNKNQLQPKKDEPNAVTSYEEYKKQTEDSDVQAAPPADLDALNLFTKVSHLVQLNEKLQYSVLATDGDTTTYSSKYSENVGKGVPGITIASVIKDSKGKVLSTSNGTTDSSGSLDLGPYTIPGQTDKKKFTVETSATHGQSGKTASTRDVFRTVLDVNDNYSGKPTAKAAASITKINTDVTESIKAAVEKYKGLDTRLNHTTHDGEDFIDMTNPNSPKRLTHTDLMGLLKDSGHVKTDGRNLSWDFCWSLNVTLNAGSSSDPEGDDLVYKWEFDGPSRYAGSVDTAFTQTDPVSKAVINLTSAESVLFTFTLVVNDLEFDSNKDFVTVKVEPDTSATPVLCDLS